MKRDKVFAVFFLVKLNFRHIDEGQRQKDITG